MTIVPLTAGTVKGDALVLTVTIKRTDQDFSELTASAEVFRAHNPDKLVLIAGLTPTCVVSNISLGSADIAITLTDTQTDTLVAGDYALRLRVETPDPWGPYTPVQFNFSIIGP